MLVHRRSILAFADFALQNYKKKMTYARKIQKKTSAGFPVARLL